MKIAYSKWTSVERLAFLVWKSIVLVLHGIEEPHHNQYHTIPEFLIHLLSYFSSLSILFEGIFALLMYKYLQKEKKDR